MTLRTRLANKLANSTPPPSLLVVSDSFVGTELAAEIDAGGDIHLVTDRAGVASRAPDSARTTVGDLTGPDTLGVAADADIAVIDLQQDRRALLVAQLLRTRFDIDSLVVVLNDPQRYEALDGVATDIVCRTTCLSTALSDTLERGLPKSTTSHS